MDSSGCLRKRSQSTYMTIIGDGQVKFPVHKLSSLSIIDQNALDYKNNLKDQLKKLLDDTPSTLFIRNYTKRVNMTIYTHQTPDLLIQVYKHSQKRT